MLACRLMRPRLRPLLGVLLLASGIAVAQAPQGTPADRIVAVVDDDPLLASDLSRAIAFGLTERLDEEEDDAYQRRVLDRLIEEKLRFHEIDRFGFQELPLEEVSRSFNELRRGFPSQEAFDSKLEELGLTEEQLKEILARQLLVLVFVEERLGPRVFVSLDSIREYYEETLVPTMRRRGRPVPELDEVREQIRTVLREARLNEEIEAWTRELELRADIVSYLEERPAELPPLVNDR